MSTGQGHRGYCRICDHPAAQFLNQKYEADPPDAKGKTGFNSAKAREFAATLDLTFDRATWYSHVKHITHPLMSLVKAAQENPIVVPKTNQGVLEAIRDLGMKRAIENPEEVTIDHAIRAADILEGKKLGSETVIAVIARFMAAAKPEEIVGEDIIVGRWRELPVEEGITNGNS